MNETHTHTADCIAVNELNEFCCHVDDSHLNAQTCRRTVRVSMQTRGKPIVTDVHTFTDDDADAFALVRAAYPDTVNDPMEIVFRDTHHNLDKYAHPSHIRDIPNDPKLRPRDPR